MDALETDNGMYYVMVAALDLTDIMLKLKHKDSERYLG